MRLGSPCIPLGLAWSSPFARWQGSLADVNSLDLAAAVTGDALARRHVDPAVITRLVMGWTVPQRESFYGAPTLAARLGATDVSGAMLSQACATGVACLEAAAATVALEPDAVVLVVTTDRTSNGPVLIHPGATRPGGTPDVERWVLDSFERDPWGGTSMVATAEAVAAEAGMTKEELDDLTLVRYEQYRDALADDRAFQRSWMVPVSIERRRGAPLVIDADEGVHDTTAEALAKLSPVTPGGVVSYGSQTHPADGTAGMVVAGAARARELSGGEGVARILGTGFARVERGRMPRAPVPAARIALDHAGLRIDQIDIIKTHNPFAVNDLWFARETGVDVRLMNPYGSSLVYGHPQAPTGARGVAELIEILRRRGGGTGLFTGCAAGDTGAAVVLRVEES
ncbi:MAG: acetyl-CoA acyltransferase [Actinomycetota bacterium]|jgi:acetyl-CoA C-acetyltransferase|nr:acetyl-CoA acyltransferase [Actinomycetota bacterium]MDQ1504547.1 acetyl-CoA acyltransferase [Actinomycetota bacterium]